ncbi:hypothetical protein ACWGJB_37625 [Streptomyces sp. NPDC054813]
MDAAGKPFLMHVEDVFCRDQGRVVMLAGRIERGRVRKGDEVEIVGFGGEATVTVRLMRPPREKQLRSCAHDGPRSPSRQTQGRGATYRSP